jgi:hypothetical protein
MASPGSSCQNTIWPLATTRRPACSTTVRRARSSSPRKGSTLPSSVAAVLASKVLTA